MMGFFVNAQKSASAKTLPARDVVMGIVEPHVKKLGFEIVNIEINSQRDRRLRLYIEKNDTKPVSLDDCASVSQALDKPLDQSLEVESIFSGPYELEVSSPGICRPLWKLKDYARFEGQRVRVHTYRPLSAEELSNKTYSEKNPKQKNFVGILGKSNEDHLYLSVDGAEITIPFSMITKANLDPELS